MGITSPAMTTENNQKGNMTKFDFSKTYEDAADKYNLGKGQYFKIQEGKNVVRLVSECLPHESQFKGQTTFKWLCQVLDRKDGKIKPFFMPNTIYRHIQDLQLSDDYSFTEVPMPYDLTINAVGAGDKSVKYTVTPARQNTALTVQEVNSISEAPTVFDLQKKIRENESKDTSETDKIAEDTPF